MTQVVNIRKSDHDIYCGRPSPWVNPFRIGPDGGRDAVIAKHNPHVRKQILSVAVTLERLASLHGQWLGCYCKPAPCHADFLAQLADTAHAILGLLSRFREQGAAPYSRQQARVLSCQFLATGAGNIHRNADGTMKSARIDAAAPIRLPPPATARSS